MGGYYVSDKDKSLLNLYCEQCGDSDFILLSWEDGKRKEALENYFYKIKADEKLIIDDFNDGISYDDMIHYLMYGYDEDREIIHRLLEDGIITMDEKKSLLKKVSLGQKEQFMLLKNVFSNFTNDKVKVLKK